MTIILVGTTVLVAWEFSIPIGIYLAVRQHSVEDYTSTFIGFVGLAVSDYFLPCGCFGSHSTTSRISVSVGCFLP
ncbi:MAG: hypothetical protein QGI49_02565, partial [SAR202 cluster bacterium]|nr:hypothetical protein [SAR202 cluster bacterium]